MAANFKVTVDSEGHMKDEEGLMIKLVLEGGGEGGGDEKVGDGGDNCVIIEVEPGDKAGLSSFDKMYKEMSDIDKDLPDSEDEFQEPMKMHTPTKAGRPKVSILLIFK